MKSILYLHGLESSNICDKVDFLKENANVVAPSNVDINIYIKSIHLYYLQ